ARVSRFGLAIGAGLVTGSLPSIDASLGASLAWRLHRLVRLELDGAYAFPQTTRVEADAGGSLALLVLGAHACLPFGRAVEAALCAGVAIDNVHGHGVGVPIVRQADAWWWGPEAGMTARVDLSAAFGLRASMF